ncbi:hypothetical protein PoB_006878100 [Plakobranchus ocellatus]|uniref:Uncharacterized protein n=1 Tax=Plakobranchus ocellatus TaxID=259542 RepID=A0AAV4DDT4_9GAST|nr:hypothetical protein PoB_006878100 [Plakobranchus ocellatus]
MAPPQRGDIRLSAPSAQCVGGGFELTTERPMQISGKLSIVPRPPRAGPDQELQKGGVPWGPQQGDHWLSCPPSSQGAGGGTRFPAERSPIGLREIYQKNERGKKTNESVLEEVKLERSIIKTTRRRQLEFPRHICRHKSLERLAITGKIEGIRSKDFGVKQSTNSTSTSSTTSREEGGGGVGGTVACESALRSAVTLLSRVRAPPSAPRPDGGPKSLRLPCRGLAIYKNPTETLVCREVFLLFL